MDPIFQTTDYVKMVARGGKVMAHIRKKHNAQSKASIAIEALKERKTTSEIASDEGVHPVQVAKWKKELIVRASEIFEKESGPDNDEFYQKIGQLNMEISYV
jgi:transposase-like protein